MKLFNPPSSASDDGVLAFQTFTALRACHDDNGKQRLESEWVELKYSCGLIRKISEAAENGCFSDISADTWHVILP